MPATDLWKDVDYYGLKVMADRLASNCHAAHASDAPVATATYNNVSDVWDKLSDSDEAVTMFKTQMLVPALMKHFTPDKTVTLKPSLVYDDRDDSLRCKVEVLPKKK